MSMKLVTGVIGAWMFFAMVVPAYGADSNVAATPKSSSRNVIVPYYFPYDRYNYSDQQYFRRMLDDYERANQSRFNQLNTDIAGIEGDLKWVYDKVNAADADTQQILRKLEKIERDLGNVNGRLKKMEKSVQAQATVIQKLSNRLGEKTAVPIPLDANVPAEPNEKK
jgi:peptidoglycan hydrolase CwlO-like protein